MLLGFVPCQARVPICGLASPSRSGYSLRFGASPRFAPFSMATSATAEACHRAAGKLGPIWKKYRKKFPPAVRDLFAELLLEMRLVIMPSEFLCATANIGSSRYDIRGIAELLKQVSCSDPLPPVTTNAGIATRSSTTLLPPPPPPPLLFEGQGTCNRAIATMPTILKLEELIDICRTDEESFESILNYNDKVTETLIASETKCVDPTNLECVVSSSSLWKPFPLRT